MKKGGVVAHAPKGGAMKPRDPFARSLAAGLLVLASLPGCELALHEVQQAEADGCDPRQAGCQARVEDSGPSPAQAARIDAGRWEIVSAALEAPYRRCDGVGLVCQGRIIGDVLWDQYLMVLAGRSEATSTAASVRRAVPAGAGAPVAGEAAFAPSSPAAATRPAEPPGQIVRTHGSRAGAAATTAAHR